MSADIEPTTGPGRGRPPIGAPTPVRLGERLTRLADARAAKLGGIARAEVIRRAVAADLDPDGEGAVAAAKSWEQRPIDGESRWSGEFPYGPPWDEPNLCEDWSVYTARVGESADSQYLGAPGDPLVALTLLNGAYLSVDSAEALARSLLAAIARMRGHSEGTEDDD